MARNIRTGINKRHHIDILRKTTFCVVVPAYNEGVVISKSLQSLKQAISSQHIYVVSDGSTDDTAELARGQVNNVLELKRNVGKATAIERLIKKYELTKYYKYVMFFDADTEIQSNFFQEVKKYITHKPACIVGTVSSHKRGLISAYRTYEYGLSHMLFKNAQNAMGVVLVAPGCASIYRSSVLEKLDFGNHTLTEDYDLTLQIHMRRLGRIVYAPKAVVMTQDPMTLKDYWKQILRWQTGGWQNLFLHRLYEPKNRISFEFYLILLDSILGLITLVYGLAHPAIAKDVLVAFYAGFLLFAGVILLLKQSFWALPAMVVFPFFYALGLISYIYSFFRAILGGKDLNWNKVARYAS